MSTSFSGGDLAAGVMIGYIIGLIIGLAAIFLLAIIPSKIAKKKGYSGAGFYWFGVGALVPAIIVACVLRNRNVKASENTPTPTPTS